MVQAGDDQSNGKETDEVKTYFGSKTTRCAGGLNLTACAQPKENSNKNTIFITDQNIANLCWLYHLESM